MSNELEQSIENAQKITLGQVDNGTLATAVTCAESLAIVRHGRVESYVIPKHLIDDVLMKVAVIECENKRLLGERVAGSIPVPKSHFFNHDFKVDMDAVTSSDMPSVFETMQEMGIRRRIHEHGTPDALRYIYIFDFSPYLAKRQPVKIKRP